jgi:hypothetical protein
MVQRHSAEGRAERDCVENRQSCLTYGTLALLQIFIRERPFFVSPA